MNDTLTFIWSISLLPLLFRVILDNWRIQRDYKRMSEELSGAIAISKETEGAFRGFFKWCSRTHWMMMYMAVSHYGYGVVYGVTFFESIVIGVELLIMLFIHYPQQQFTRVILERFFRVDLEELNRRLAA